MVGNNSHKGFDPLRVLDATGSMVIACDLRGVVQMFNPAAERLLGWAAAEVVGKQTPMLWHDADAVAKRAQELSAELRRVVEPGFEVFVAIARSTGSETRQWTYIDRQGIRFPVQLIVTTLRDELDQIVGYVGTGQDIRERVLAEQERDMLFELSSDMIAIAGTDSRFRRVNPAFTKTLGWTPHELTSRSFLEFVHPADRQITQMEVERLAAGQPTIQFENRYHCQNGKLKWLQWMVTPHADGTLYAIARDVTERKAMEEALHQREQSLSITLQSIGDAVIATDVQRRITHMNPVAERLTGWTQSEAIGLPIDDVFRIVNETDGQPVDIPVDDVLRTGSVHKLANHTSLIGKAGSETPISDTAAPIRDLNGQMVGVVLVFRDASLERKYQRQLEQLNSNLEHLVDVRTKHLIDNERRLRQGNQILESLTSDATLNETLTLIANLVEADNPNLRCSILLTDDSKDRVVHGAAPNIPTDFVKAIEDDQDFCRDLVTAQQRIVVPNLRQDANWQSRLPLLETTSFHGCFVEPIWSDAQQPLAAFVAYSVTPDSPDPSDFERVECVSGLVRLAIERGGAQAALIESERFSRAILDTLSAHVAVIDESGTIVATNQAWKRFAECNGSDWQPVSEGTDYLAVCESAAATGNAHDVAMFSAIQDVIVGRLESCFLEYPCHSLSEQRWYYCRLNRLVRDDAVFVIVSHENVTEIRVAQEKLSASLARYETLSAVSPVGILLFDEFGGCIEANRRWSELSSFPEEMAFGQGWLDFVHHSDKSRVESEMKSTIKSKAVVESEFRLAGTTGQERWVYCQTECVLDAIGQVTGYVKIFTDVTERKLLELAMKALSVDLASLNGRQFYETGIATLTRLTGCEAAIICFKRETSNEFALTSTLNSDDNLQTDFNYPIDGKLSQDVFEVGHLAIGENAARLYPQESFLVDEKIEAFFGRELRGSSGREIGQIVLLSRRKQSNLQQISAVLDLFALAITAEVEREAVERRLTDLFEYLPDAIILVSEQGQIIQANRQVESVFGWSAIDLVGESIDVLIPSEYRANHRKLLDEFVEQHFQRSMGTHRTTQLGLHRDGRLIHVQINLIPMKTIEGNLVAAAVRDVSEHHRVQLAMNEANAFANTVIENVSGLFYVIDQEGRYVRWNQTLPELLGVAPDQMRSTLVISIIHPDDREDIAAKMQEVFEMGQAEAEGRLLTKFGVRDYVFNGRRIEIAGDVFLAGSGNDITDRKRAEAEVIRLNQTLEARVQLRTEELRIANERLVAASQAKTDFLATMSHELRTPLNGILGMNQLLLATDLTAAQAEFVKASNSSGKLLLQLINDVLDLSKIEAGKMQLSVRKASFKSFVENLYQVMVHSASAKGLTLERHISPDACIIGWFDDMRLQQVMVNLLGNAIKFTEAGTVSILVDKVGEQGPLSRLRFSVADTGIGIPADRMNRLFRVFSQIDSSTTRQFGGTGLGLAICKLLIEMMGGDISVESEVGIGTKFWFEIEVLTVGKDPELASESQELEVTTQVTAKARAPRHASETSGKPKFTGHVLVAEDNKINELYIVNLLQNYGCKGTVARNGTEVLELIDTAHFDLVLMDCQMPVLDGFEATKEIRKREAGGSRPGRIPIIALTANALAGDRERCLAAGMDDYISKPVDPKQFENLLRLYLQLSRPR